MTDAGQSRPEMGQGVEAERNAEDTKRAIRRRILKAGLVGAPLVITLKSNSGWAASTTCLQNLRVPSDIPQDISKSSGNLVNYSGTSDQRRYLNTIARDQRYTGMPGYSCVASLMLTQR